MTEILELNSPNLKLDKLHNDMGNIETQRLYLRDYQESDYDAIYEYNAMTESTRYMPDGLEDLKTVIKKFVIRANINPRYQFEKVIIRKEDNLLIGEVSIKRDSQYDPKGYVGFIINPAFQKQGFATEATKGIIKFGFEKLNLKCIYGLCMFENLDSIRIMEKFGMKCVGIVNQPMIGKSYQFYRYEVTDEEFHKL